MEVQMWAIEKLNFYARHPRKNEAAVLEGDGRTFAQIAGARLREVWDAAA